MVTEISESPQSISSKLRISPNDAPRVAAYLVVTFLLWQYMTKFFSLSKEIIDEMAVSVFVNGLEPERLLPLPIRIPGDNRPHLPPAVRPGMQRVQGPVLEPRGLEGLFQDHPNRPRIPVPHGAVKRARVQGQEPGLAYHGRTPNWGDDTHSRRGQRDDRLPGRDPEGPEGREEDLARGTRRVISLTFLQSRSTLLSSSSQSCCPPSRGRNFTSIFDNIVTFLSLLLLTAFLYSAWDLSLERHKPSIQDQKFSSTVFLFAIPFVLFVILRVMYLVKTNEDWRLSYEFMGTLEASRDQTGHGRSTHRTTPGGLFFRAGVINSARATCSA